MLKKPRRLNQRPKLIELTTDPVTGVSTLRIWRFVSEPWIGKKAQAEFQRKLDAIRKPALDWRHQKPAGFSDLEEKYILDHPEIWPTPHLHPMKKPRRARRTK